MAARAVASILGPRRRNDDDDALIDFAVQPRPTPPNPLESPETLAEALAEKPSTKQYKMCHKSIKGQPDLSTGEARRLLHGQSTPGGNGKEP
jgi:hypothetical protein